MNWLRRHDVLNQNKEQANRKRFKHFSVLHKLSLGVVLEFPVLPGHRNRKWYASTSMHYLCQALSSACRLRALKCITRWSFACNYYFILFEFKYYFNRYVYTWQKHWMMRCTTVPNQTEPKGGAIKNSMAVSSSIRRGICVVYFIFL